MSTLSTHRDAHPYSASFLVGSINISMVNDPMMKFCTGRKLRGSS